MNSIKKRIDKLNILVIVPTYNNQTTIVSVIEDIQKYAQNILIMNDGCTDDTVQLLNSMPNKDRVQLISYPKNKGKGYALKKSLKYASTLGYKYALTIDADGQHYAKDIECFVDAIEDAPNCLLIGSRDLKADNMPSKNTFANKFSNFWYRVETGEKLSDTQSGFRLYPLEPFKKWIFFSSRYEFEVEVIVRAAWKGIRVKNIPIHVYYPPEELRVSHFRPFVDFLRISILNTILVLISILFYYPFKFVRSLTWNNFKSFLKNNITQSQDTNITIAAAIGVGVFMGIAPFWGYQIILCFALAHLLKLNKLLVIVSAHISIPPMIPFILYLSYWIGCKILSVPISLSIDTISFDRVFANLFLYVLGSFMLAFISGLCFFLLFWFFLSIKGRKPYRK